MELLKILAPSPSSWWPLGLVVFPRLGIRILREAGGAGEAWFSPFPLSMKLRTGGLWGLSPSKRREDQGEVPQQMDRPFVEGGVVGETLL